MRIHSSKSRTSRQNHGLKFGMVGTYKSYFRNVKRRSKVIFDHSTTLIKGACKTKLFLLVNQNCQKGIIIVWENSMYIFEIPGQNWPRMPGDKVKCALYNFYKCLEGI